MKRIQIGSTLRKAQPRYCGEGEPTLVIGSIGTSDEADAIETEVEKAIVAQQAGADIVTDHSFYGDIPTFHTELAHSLDILLSTVGCYEYAAKHRRESWVNVSSTSCIHILEKQIERGVDMITVHASLRQSHLPLLATTSRLIPTTSKGGGIISSYIRSTGKENPYYEHFDDILRLFSGANVTLSLGTTYRPATVCDGWDDLMGAELQTMGELVERALEKDVQVMIEGIGHATLSAIPTYVRLGKMYCLGVPYRILPMATDAALGFDHISGAIATATAISAGADVVTAMSRAEHIGLPTTDELREAIIATKIAAHCGDIVRLGDLSKDSQISRTRWQQGCKGDWTMAVVPEGARAALKAHGRLEDQMIQCGMCGDYCGIAAGISSHKAAKRREEP